MGLQKKDYQLNIFTLVVLVLSLLFYYFSMVQVFLDTQDHIGYGCFLLFYSSQLINSFVGEYSNSIQFTMILTLVSHKNYTITPRTSLLTRWNDTAQFVLFF